MLPRDRKIVNDCPCLFTVWNKEKARWDITAPQVDCGFRCDSCDWNPREHERRMREGEWVELMDGTRRLVFRSKEVMDAAN